MIKEPLERAVLALAASINEKDPMPWFHSLHGLPTRIADLARWPGSRNFRIVAEAAGLSTHPGGTVGFFDELETSQRQTGDGGLEEQSEIYEPIVVAAWLRAHRLGSAGAGRYLRRLWGRLALQTVPWTIKQAFLNREERTDPIHSSTSLTTVLAGDRWNPAAVGQKVLGGMVEWALDWPDRYWPHEKDNHPWPESPEDDWVLKPWDYALRVVDGRGNDSRQVWGLTGSDQAACRAVIRGRPTTRDLNHVLEMVGDSSQAEEYKRLWVIRTDASLTVAREALANHNKPGVCWAELDSDGTYRAFMPGWKIGEHFPGVGAPIPEISWGPDSARFSTTKQWFMVSWPARRGWLFELQGAAKSMAPWTGRAPWNAVPAPPPPPPPPLPPPSVSVPSPIRWTAPGKPERSSRRPRSAIGRFLGALMRVFR